MRRVARYISASKAFLTRCRALLTVLITEPARAATFYRDLQSLGLRETAGRILRVIFQDASYRKWVELYDTISPREAEQIRGFLARLRIKPKFSILVPVYQTPRKELTEMIASVKAQVYDDWELCIADDGSGHPHVREILEAQTLGEPRIKFVIRAENGNISAASNSALALATGDFLVLLDHDDLLAPHALAIMADAINRHPDADVLYSDEDKLDAEGRRYGAYFKPDWNAELLYGQNFISHLGVYRTSLVRALGGFRLGFEGSQDYDLALRATALTKGPVVHVPHVLYHWRVYPGASTFSSTQLRRAVDAARRAIKEQLAGKGIEAEVGDAGYNCHRVIRASPATWPRVSIIASLRQHLESLPGFIESLLERTDYPDIEIVVINASDGKRALPTELLNKRRIRFVQSPNPTDFAKTVNQTVRDSSGEIILFLDDDLSVVEPGWLKEMVVLAMQPGVGAVGAKLRAADGRTWLGGMILGLDQIAGSLQGNSASTPGYFGKLILTQEVSCVSAACMAVSRASFKSVGGFDESNLAPSFRDIDLCIRLRHAGYRVMWTPHARLHHQKRKTPRKSGHEQRSKREREITYMRERFGQSLERDPFWNPNLSLASRPQVALPPRIARPWQEGGDK